MYVVFDNLQQKIQNKNSEKIPLFTCALNSEFCVSVCYLMSFLLTGSLDFLSIYMISMLIICEMAAPALKIHPEHPMKCKIYKNTKVWSEIAFIFSFFSSCALRLQTLLLAPLHLLTLHLHLLHLHLVPKHLPLHLPPHLRPGENVCRLFFPTPVWTSD